VEGEYHVLPRAWLAGWRRYMRDPEAPVCPPLDAVALLCRAHGRVVPPPHLEEYLQGGRRRLLAGLGEYPGVAVELLSGGEYEALRRAGAARYLEVGGSVSGGRVSSSGRRWVLPDYSVRVSVESEAAGGGVRWCGELCRSCDPFNYAAVTVASTGKRIHHSLIR
jgi:hypothetical protein